MTGRRAGQAATGCALRGLPRARSTTTTGEPITANDVDLSTTRFDRGGLPPLVNVQSARVVRIRSARTNMTDSTRPAALTREQVRAEVERAMRDGTWRCRTGNRGWCSNEPVATAKPDADKRP